MLSPKTASTTHNGKAQELRRESKRGDPGSKTVTALGVAIDTTIGENGVFPYEGARLQGPRQPGFRSLSPDKILKAPSEMPKKSSSARGWLIPANESRETLLKTLGPNYNPRHNRTYMENGNAQVPVICKEVGLSCRRCTEDSATSLAKICKGLRGGAVRQLFFQIYPAEACASMSSHFARSYKAASREADAAVATAPFVRREATREIAWPKAAAAVA